MVLILLNGFLMNSIYSQEIEQDSSKTEIFELDQGCKLILKKKIDLTDSASTEIVEGIRNIIPTVQKLIPTDSVTINLTTDSENILHVWGIGARTSGGGDTGERVEIYFDPNHPNFKIENIFRTLVHEMHHVARIRNPDFELTLLECMVNEGLADHFMIEVLNCEITPWANALTEEQIQKKEELEKIRQQHSRTIPKALPQPIQPKLQIATKDELYDAMRAAIIETMQKKEKLKRRRMRRDEQKQKKIQMKSLCKQNL